VAASKLEICWGWPPFVTKFGRVQESLLGKLTGIVAEPL
jgi:hypothetical protein